MSDLKATLAQRRERLKGDVDSLWNELNGLSENEDSKDEDVDSAQDRYEKALGEFSKADDRYRKQLELEIAERKESPPDDGGDGGDEGDAARWMTPGDRLISSPQYKALHDRGVFRAEHAPVNMSPVQILTKDEFRGIQTKAEGDSLITGASATSAGAFVTNQRLPGFYEVLNRIPRVAQLMTNVDINTEVAEWVRETAFTNAAAEVAEASGPTTGLKPESSLALVVENTSVQSIAHHFNVTRRAAADASQIRDLINAELRRGIALRLDTQLVSGNGTPPNLRGVLNTSGIGTQARATDSRADAVRKAITVIRTAFLEPNAVLMHPTDVQTLVLEKNTNADYYYGSPADGAAGAPRVWGLPIIESPVISAGTALVGDWSNAYLFIREGVSVLSSENVNDFFVRNILTFLAEMRVAIGIPRPAAFCQVTGM